MKHINNPEPCGLYIVENGEKRLIGHVDRCLITPTEYFQQVQTEDAEGDIHTEEIRVNTGYDYTFYLVDGAEPASEPETKDMVNHPAHYERENAMESIDEMLLVFGARVVAAFCLCNAWKYRYRALTKNGEEDIKKSDWYMAKYAELAKQHGFDTMRDL